MATTDNPSTYPIELVPGHTLVDHRRNRERLLHIQSIDGESVQLKYQNGKTFIRPKSNLLRLLNDNQLKLLLGTTL